MASEDVDPRLTIELDIRDDIPADLDHFILLSRKGFFTEAEDFYADNLSRHIAFGAIRIEYALHLLRQGSFYSLRTFVTQKSLDVNHDRREEARLFIILEKISNSKLKVDGRTDVLFRRVDDQTLKNELMKLLAKDDPDDLDLLLISMLLLLVNTYTVEEHSVEVIDIIDRYADDLTINNLLWEAFLMIQAAFLHSDRALKPLSLLIETAQKIFIDENHLDLVTMRLLQLDSLFFKTRILIAQYLRRDDVVAWDSRDRVLADIKAAVDSVDESLIELIKTCPKQRLEYNLAKLSVQGADLLATQATCEDGDLSTFHDQCGDLRERAQRARYWWVMDLVTELERTVTELLPLTLLSSSQAASLEDELRETLIYKPEWSSNASVDPRSLSITIISEPKDIARASLELPDAESLAEGETRLDPMQPNMLSGVSPSETTKEGKVAPRRAQSPSSRVDEDAIVHGGSSSNESSEVGKHHSETSKVAHYRSKNMIQIKRQGTKESVVTESATTSNFKSVSAAARPADEGTDGGKGKSKTQPSREAHASNALSFTLDFLRWGFMQEERVCLLGYSVVFTERNPLSLHLAIVSIQVAQATAKEMGSLTIAHARPHVRWDKTSSKDYTTTASFRHSTASQHGVHAHDQVEFQIASTGRHTSGTFGTVGPLPPQRFAIVIRHDFSPFLLSAKMVARANHRDQRLMHFRTRTKSDAAKMVLSPDLEAWRNFSLQDLDDFVDFGVFPTGQTRSPRNADDHTQGNIDTLSEDHGSPRYRHATAEHSPDTHEHFQFRGEGTSESATSVADRRLYIQLGWYSAAIDILRDQITAHPGDIDLKAELALAHFRAGLWGHCNDQARDLLKKQPQGEITIVLELLAGISGVYTSGALKTAFDAANRHATYIAHEYQSGNSAHMSTIVELYLRIMKQAATFSNWPTTEDKRVPWVEEDGESWSTYVLWIEILYTQEKYYEAWLVFKLICSNLEVAQRKELGKRIIDGCSLAPKSTSRSLTVIGMSTTLASWLVEVDKDTASAYRLSAEARFQELPEHLKEHSSQDLDLRALEIQLSDQVDSSAVAKRWVDLANIARDWSNLTRADDYFTRACELALQESMFESFSIWRKQHEQLLEHEMRNIRDLMTGRSRQWRWGSEYQVSRQLDWFDSMDQKLKARQGEPPFDDPMAIYVVQLTCHSIATRISDTERIAKSEERIREVRAQLPHIVNTAIPYLAEWTDLSINRSLPPRVNKQGILDIVVLLRRLRILARAGRLPENLHKEIAPGIPLDQDMSQDQEIDCASQIYSHLWHGSKNEWLNRLILVGTEFQANDQTTVERDATQHLLLRLMIGRNMHVETSLEGIQEHSRLVAYFNDCSLEIRRSMKETKLNSLRTIAMCHMNAAQWPIQSSEGHAHLELAFTKANEALNFLKLDKTLIRDARHNGLLYSLLADITNRQRLAGARTIPFDTVRWYLRQADGYYDTLRQDLVALDVPTGVYKQAHFADSVIGVKSLLRHGTWAHVREVIDHPGDKQARINLWEWVQRSKSRTWTDRLALTVRMPEAISHAAEKDPDAAKAIKEWREAVEAIKEASNGEPTALFYARARRDDVLKQMETISVLAPYARLASGKTLEFADLRAALQSSKDAVAASPLVLVDWFTSTTLVGVEKWLMLIVKLHEDPTQEPHIHLWGMGDVNTSQLNTWVDKYFPSKPEASSEVIKRLMLREEEHAGASTAPDVVPSIQSLSLTMTKDKSLPAAEVDLNNIFAKFLSNLPNFITKYDKLIFCPTGRLHRVPLHAVKLAATTTRAEGPLIDTNTVVYCHSLSMIRNAIQNVDPLPSDMPAKERALQLVPLNPEKVRADVVTLRDDMRDIVGGLRLQENQVSRQRTTKALAACSNVFFLGHVHDNQKEALASHLCLYEETIHSHENCFSNPESILTAKDILESTRIRRGASVVVIACASGTPIIVGADEPIGLVPSFLGAGASSIVSTLWPVRTWTAVELAVHFTRLKARAHVPRQLSVIDMAECLRQAALYVRDNVPKAEFVDWAPYVFHGYWNQIWLPSEDYEEDVDL